MKTAIEISKMNEDERKATVKLELVKMKKIDKAGAEKLALKYNIKDRSVISIAVRAENVEYVKLAKVSKTGAKVETKENLVSEIAEITGITFSGMDKATKTDLVNLRDFLKAEIAAEDEDEDEEPEETKQAV